MDFVDIMIGRMPAFAMTLVRVTGFLTLAPAFSQRSVPIPYRFWIGMMLTLILLPIVNAQALTGVTGIAYLPLVLRELAVGLLIGFVVMLALTSGNLAGKIVGVQMGYGLATVMDPITSEQGTLIDQLNGLIVLILFFTLGGHRMIILALSKSFEVVPLGIAQWPGGITDGVLQLFFHVILLGIQIAIPVMASVFIVEAAVGVLSKGAPQFNVFTIGLPMRILVGAIVLIGTIPLLVALMKKFIFTLPGELDNLIHLLAPQGVL